MEYIAREAARRYGPIEPDLPGKVRRNVKRGFGSDLSTEEVRTLLLHYKEIYAFAASILRNNREYWEQDFVRSGDAAWQRFVGLLVEKYHRERRAILDMVAKCASYYELLS